MVIYDAHNTHSFLITDSEGVEEENEEDDDMTQGHESQSDNDVSGFIIFTEFK